MCAVKKDGDPINERTGQEMPREIHAGIANWRCDEMNRQVRNFFKGRR